MCPSGTDTPDLPDPGTGRGRRASSTAGPTDPARAATCTTAASPTGQSSPGAWFINPASDTPARRHGRRPVRPELPARTWPSAQPAGSSPSATSKFTVDEYSELEQFGGIYDATDPDLSAFRAHGGKLIIYHGWADQAIPPFATIDYYPRSNGDRRLRGQPGVLAAVHGSRRLPLPGRRRPGGDRELPHPADQLGGEGTGPGRG